jgi:transglutaminase-like putative cysteine protease
MYYHIEHITRFRYSQPISESVMEVHMQPRTEGNQRCLNFNLHTNPQARTQHYPDYLKNVVHFFDIPFKHTQLILRAESLVELLSPPSLPESLSADSWSAIDALTREQDHWEFLRPSERTEPTELLNQFAAELDVRRRDDPLTVLRQMNMAIYEAFDYMPESTDVDSPIDEALEKRRGVCQDLAHIMIALVRGLGIPSRYVSGYLYYRHDNPDRSTPDQSHAWVEALLPSLGWVGFDPTNNIMAGERHIRVAIGRDYSDVPPTKGVFKGAVESELEVEVHVTQVDQPIETLMPVTESWIMPLDEAELLQEQQQQQQ